MHAGFFHLFIFFRFQINFFKTKNMNNTDVSISLDPDQIVSKLFAKVIARRQLQTTPADRELAKIWSNNRENERKRAAYSAVVMNPFNPIMHLT